MGQGTRCCEEITDAVNDYAAERDRLRDEVVDEDFPDMASARAKMDQKVIIPKPCWPKVSHVGSGEPYD